MLDRHLVTEVLGAALARGGSFAELFVEEKSSVSIRLDDGKHSIRLENSSGSYYELTPQKVRVHAAADLEIEAPGQRVVIRGKNIDFEKG